MKPGKILLASLATCAALAVARDAAAQQLLMPRIGGYSTAPEAQLPNPTVSPYLLMTDAGQTGMFNYQTLVQPLVQQRMTTNHQNASINNLQQQVQNVKSNSGGRRGGQNKGDSGGHESRYLNYSHYYSSFSNR